MRLAEIAGTLCLAAAMLSLTGCAAKKALEANTVAAADKPSADAAVFATQLAQGAGGPAKLRVVSLEIHELVIPLGAISRSEEFWKHVEEERIDVGTYDLLRKNGWRLGIAPNSEWNYFRDILDQYPASRTPRAIAMAPGGAGGSMEIPVKEAVPYQVISYFSDEHSLFLRSFERADNLLNVTVQHVARKPGEARVTVCPTVRSLKRRIEVTGNNKEREIRFVHPERLYDLNLQVDIPMGYFLVIAPSPEVKWKTSLGAAFLVRDDVAEQLERVLLLVPHAKDLEETVPVAPAPQAVPAK